MDALPFSLGEGLRNEIHAKRSAYLHARVIEADKIITCRMSSLQGIGKVDVVWKGWSFRDAAESVQADHGCELLRYGGAYQAHCRGR